MATIVLLGSYAPSLINFRGSLIGALVERGHRVVAMAPEIGAELGERLRAIGAEPHDVELDNQSLNPLAMLRSIRMLARTFAALRPDAVIAYTVKPVTLGAVAAARAGVPRFVSMITGLGYAFSGGRTAKRRLSEAAATLLYRRALRRSSAIVFQNPDDRDFFRTRGILPSRPEPIVVGGSGIDLVHFSPAPLPEGCRFLMISRLLGDKGLREYGEAARRLKAKHPEARFALVGYFDNSPDAISRDELAAMQAGGIEFLGKMDDVRPAIADCSVYVLPSYREGTPRSVLEAMAMGRAIVTTDAPGCRQTVDHGRNGLLAEPRDADSLEAAMERFIADPAMIAPMGAQSRRIAEERFDVNRVNEQMLAAAGL
jgi:glycosyltransferase involved in cell wall biosynthesis